MFSSQVASLITAMGIQVNDTGGEISNTGGGPSSDWASSAGAQQQWRESEEAEAPSRRGQPQGPTSQGPSSHGPSSQGPASQGPASQQGHYSGAPPPVPKVKMLTRASIAAAAAEAAAKAAAAAAGGDGGDGGDAGDSAGGGFGAGAEGGSLGGGDGGLAPLPKPDFAAMSIAEKQAHYAAVRARIMGPQATRPVRI